MSKILVTGAGGYIGSVAAYLFLSKGHEVVGLDNFVTGYRAPLVELQNKFGKKQFRYYELDLNNSLASLFNIEPGIEAVVHYAAHCMVDESMKNPSKYFRNNVGGSLNLVSQLIEHDIRKIVFSSTCAVYGEAEYVPVDEKHSTNPTNPYGESKRMVEKMLTWFQKLKGMEYVILRYFNVCGASDDGLIGDSKHPSTLLVQNVVRGALGIASFYLTCPQVETPDKTPIRDYINVVDLNEAHLLALEHLFANKPSEIINLGTATGNSVLEVVDQVEKATGNKIKRETTTPRAGEYAKMIADITKAKNILKWQPKRSLADSVESLVKWYGNHPNGWDK